MKRFASSSVNPVINLSEKLCTRNSSCSHKFLSRCETIGFLLAIVKPLETEITFVNRLVEGLTIVEMPNKDLKIPSSL